MHIGFSLYFIFKQKRKPIGIFWCSDKYPKHYFRFHGILLIGRMCGILYVPHKTPLVCLENGRKTYRQRRKHLFKPANLSVWRRYISPPNPVLRTDYIFFSYRGKPGDSWIFTFSCETLHTHIGSRFPHP